MTEQIERLLRWTLHTLVMAAWEHVRRECSGFISRAESAYAETRRLHQKVFDAGFELAKLKQRVEALEEVENKQPEQRRPRRGQSSSSSSSS